MKLYATFILLCFLQISLAQSMVTEQSDPEAIKVLDQIKKEYDRYPAHKLSFDLIIELPGQGEEIQKGSLIQAKDKFVLDMPEQKIITDNVTAWVVLKSLNEVQINDASFEDDEEMLSPSNLMQLHHSDKYVFGLSNRFQEKGKEVTQIECKPLDSDSEYSKIRLTVDEKNKTLVRIKVFAKDGSRYTLRINNHQKDFPVDKQTFNFNKADYPGVMIEDLRF